MTERCQTRFTEKFDSQNNIIYVGIIVGSLAVLYFYRFHFATVLFSYVFGCVACYFGLNSRILHNYVEQWKCHFSRNIENAESLKEAVKGCETCGSKECNRHDSGLSPDPWVGLQIHKQLDLAIEDFYNTILEQFISSWYNKISIQPFFVDELRYQLRYASASLLRRALKINYARLILERLIPCALRHYTVCAASGATSGAGAGTHPAVATRQTELRYLRALTDSIMPYLLKQNGQNSPLKLSPYRFRFPFSVFVQLIREIFAGWVLLSLTDILADPHTLNTLIILAASGETMATLPTEPSYKVEFLETFARQSETVYSLRPKLLRTDLDSVMGDQGHLYALLQLLKATSHVQLLQFYKDIKSFQTKILNPELSPAELTYLHTEACDMYTRYFTSRAALPASLHPLAAELKEMLHQTPDSVKKLQTSRALYQAARQSHAELEKVMLPKFLHSEEYYKLLIGSRIPTGYHKQMTKKPQDKLFHTAIRLGNRIKGALRSQAIDGQVLDCFANSDVSDGDTVDNVDILNYLDSLANDESEREQDLSTFKVVLTNVETRVQPPPRRGTVRVFTLAVHRAGGVGVGAVDARLWTVSRSELDFHLLRSKLQEFHGDLVGRLPLPAPRDNSPLETLRYKYEDFLQILLQKSLLQTSELLYLFLTVDSDFSMVVQASALNANGTDLANMYQNVAHKLRKEKGQHLESFLKNLLVCSDIDRFQALKQGTTHVEEALEMNEELENEQLFLKPHNGRSIQSSVFGNNWDLGCDVTELSVRRLGKLQDVVKGFSQCFMYLLTEVIHARSVLTHVLGCALGVSRALCDAAAERGLRAALRALLTERRLAHLIRLGHGLLFGKKPSFPRTDPAASHARALAALLAALPPAPAAALAPALAPAAAAAAACGPGLRHALATAVDILQVPQYNKQLVYNLLDLCVLELFPELSATEHKSKEPKS